ncbi:MAG: putative toxin-antitoxin system toxin component, PIN family [Acidobacteriota bacterium]|jgi:putative PIN family toxin of toxin-antitoxin system|nr:putative toxin-antitoxin system toxin component, PIN family [Acidobacteriota bacterium]
MIPKAVLDTNVIVSAVIQPLGKPARIFDLFMAKKIDLVVNEVILDEYEAVLRRPKFDFPFSLVTGILTYIRATATDAFSIPQPETVSDPDDQVFYDLAKTSDAVLVTGNTKHYPPDPKIMTPAQFLAAM